MQCNEEQEQEQEKPMFNILFYAIYSLCSYFMVYVVYLTMPLLCTFAL